MKVYDGDLGVGGGCDTDRHDFRQLVADVGRGRVGLVLALDATRIARNNADWHRLLDLCAVCDTLIGDSDGVYDLASYNVPSALTGPPARRHPSTDSYGPHLG